LSNPFPPKPWALKILGLQTSISNLKVLRKRAETWDTDSLNPYKKVVLFEFFKFCMGDEKGWFD